MRKIPTDILNKLLFELNPHWKTGEIDPDIKDYRKRKYFELFFPLVKETSVRRAIILMGPRRVGKTVMLFQAIQNLIDDGHNPKTIVYLPLDAPLLQGRPLAEMVGLFIEIQNHENLKNCTLIFDEIQYLENWSNHLKVLVDRNTATTFIASGSAAAALKLKSIESGAGRFTDFILPPLTFYEFLDLQGLVDKLFSPSTMEGGLGPIKMGPLNQEFINYINYGGYPESTLNPAIRENPGRYIRSDIIDKVLLRDLPSLYGIPDIQELIRLFNILAFQTGNEITYEELCKFSGISKNTLKKYIEYLEGAFLIKTLKRVDNSGKTFKRINYFKVYLTNPSMYSALFGLITGDEPEAGNLVETAIFCQMMHDSTPFTDLYYYYGRWSRGTSQGEVDLVVLDNKYKVVACLEVKWSDRYTENPGLLKSLEYFLTQHNLESVIVTTRSTWGTKSLRNTEIRFGPSAWFAFISGKNLIEGKATEIHQFLNKPEETQLSFSIDE